jgi:homoserine kinase type II
MNAPDLNVLLDTWPLPEPRAIRQVDSGTNNLSYRVTTRTGEFLLRIYRHGAQRERIAYEHALLAALDQAQLPFAVPVPIAASSGETCVEVATGDRLAAVFPWLPGDHPRLDLESLETCAGAVAELDRAMGDLDLGAPAGGMGLLGDLHRVHPAVPDPLAVADELPLMPGERITITRLMEQAIVESDRLYARGLPRQIVHRDLDPSNLFMAGGVVTAVFDFEAARPDLRAFDLAISAMTFSTDATMRAAFVSAYTGVLPLGQAELQALPMLMVIYRAMSLISREGRRRDGHASQATVVARARSLLAEAERQQIQV